MKIIETIKKAKTKVEEKKVKVKEFFGEFLYLKKSFIILFLIYVISFFAIFRANFNYIDDLGRGAYGYQGWTHFSRYVTEYLSSVIHTSDYLADISPLTQILACAILALSSCIVIHLFNDENNKKVTISKIIAVLPIGLSPYFLECISYKFDSPYMALSIFCVLVPFVFAKSSLKLYSVTSIIGILVMCMTYQASSGIYPILVILIALLWWNNKEELKKIGKFIGISILSFAVGIGVFYLFIMEPIETYVGNTVWPLNEIISGSITNLKTYYDLVISDFRQIWIVLIAIISGGFIFLSALRSKRNTNVSLVLSIIATIASYCLAFGLYITLQNPLFDTRAMYGIGIVIALLAVQCCSFVKRGLIIKGVCIALSWCFIVFSFTYGNALNEQKRYTDFRVQLVIQDLNDLDIMTTNTVKTFKLTGNIGKSPVLRNMSEDYIMLNRLIPDTFGGTGWMWADYYFENYFALPYFIYAEYWYAEPADLPVLKDTIYHTIRGNDDYIVVELKY